jgi:hypothetical protein
LQRTGSEGDLVQRKRTEAGYRAPEVKREWGREGFGFVNGRMAVVLGGGLGNPLWRLLRGLLALLSRFKRLCKARPRGERARTFAKALRLNGISFMSVPSDGSVTMFT